MNSTNHIIAITHLTTRIKQTVIAGLSVTFGISMYIFMNSFMSGVNSTQDELAFTTLANIRVYNDLPEYNTDFESLANKDNHWVNVRNPRRIQYTEGIKNSDKIVNLLRVNTPEQVGITTQVNTNVFYRNGAVKINGLLSGVDVENEDILFKISDHMEEGKWEDLNKRSNGIILGVGLAERLSVGMGEYVNLSTADNIMKSYRVVGLIKTSIASVDNGKAFVQINSVRSLLSKNSGYATDVLMNINDFEQARQVSDRLKGLTEYSVESWQESNGQLESGKVLRDIIALAVSLTILLVAGFGIYNIMTMTVNEKIKEIAILKAMGFEDKDVSKIFLMQSIIVGLLGGLVGLLFGFLVSFIVNTIPFEMPGIATLPIDFNIIYYAQSFLFGLMTTFIAGYLPAKKASGIDPVAIIRS
ncbi:MAG: FtsX-like permease family protein [Bacteroidota bacterium]